MICWSILHDFGLANVYMQKRRLLARSLLNKFWGFTHVIGKARVFENEWTYRDLGPSVFNWTCHLEKWHPNSSYILVTFSLSLIYKHWVDFSCQTIIFFSILSLVLWSLSLINNILRNLLKYWIRLLKCSKIATVPSLNCWGSHHAFSKRGQFCYILTI